jgi:hypothetical protein
VTALTAPSPDRTARPGTAAPIRGTFTATFANEDFAEDIRGTEGDDFHIIFAGDIGDGNDRFLGLGGNDVIRGGFGDDTLHGGPGDDFIFGGPGSDRLFGGGADEIRVRTASSRPIPTVTGSPTSRSRCSASTG